MGGAAARYGSTILRTTVPYFAHLHYVQLSQLGRVGWNSTLMPISTISTISQAIVLWGECELCVVLGDTFDNS